MTTKQQGLKPINEKLLKSVDILLRRLEREAIRDMNIYEEYWGQKDLGLVLSAQFIVTQLQLIKEATGLYKEINDPRDLKLIITGITNAITTEKILKDRAHALMLKSIKS